MPGLMEFGNQLQSDSMSPMRKTLNHAESETIIESSESSVTTVGVCCITDPSSKDSVKMFRREPSKTMAMILF